MSAVNPLSAEFLYELYATALRQEPLCAVLARHMRKEYLPDRSFQQVQEAIAVHFKTYKTPPSYAVLAQTFHEDYDAIELIDTFREYDEGQSAEVMTDMLESVFLLTIWKEIIILKSTVKTIIWTAVVHSLSWWQIWSRNGSRCRQS